MINQDQLSSLSSRVEALKGYLEIDRKKIEIEEEELKSQDPSFWDNPKEAELLLKKIKQKKFWVESYNSVETKLDFSELSSSSNISLLYDVSFEAKKVRIEKERRAS